jgi:hypothetical protein
MFSSILSGFLLFGLEILVLYRFARISFGKMTKEQFRREWGWILASLLRWVVVIVVLYTLIVVLNFSSLGIGVGAFLATLIFGLLIFWHESRRP